MPVTDNTVENMVRPICQIQGSQLILLDLWGTATPTKPVRADTPQIPKELILENPEFPEASQNQSRQRVAEEKVQAMSGNNRWI